MTIPDPAPAPAFWGDFFHAVGDALGPGDSALLILGILALAAIAVWVWRVAACALRRAAWLHPDESPEEWLTMYRPPVQGNDTSDRKKAA